jgi:hypothetical protein
MVPSRKTIAEPRMVATRMAVRWLKGTSYVATPIPFTPWSG